jgi:hypothetical protein
VEPKTNKECKGVEIESLKKLLHDCQFVILQPIRYMIINANHQAK